MVKIWNQKIYFFYDFSLSFVVINIIDAGDLYTH